jgi:hypothetical protein
MAADSPHLTDTIGKEKSSMKTWQKIAAMTLVVFAIGGGYLAYIWHVRHEPAAPIQPKWVERKTTADDVVVIRHLYIDDLKSAKALESKSVWMQVGYQIPYFAATGKHVELNKRVGFLPNIQELNIKYIVEQVVPASADTRISKASKQYFALFTEDGDAKEYALPVGYVENGSDTMACDTLFYYDDPHALYKHWPADVWATIDKHEVKAGMSELQTMMSLGQILQSDSDSSKMGNRTVSYTAGDAHWTVTFENDKATAVKKDS